MPLQESKAGRTADQGKTETVTKWSQSHHDSEHQVHLEVNENYLLSVVDYTVPFSSSSLRPRRFEGDMGHGERRQMRRKKI